MKLFQKFTDRRKSLKTLPTFAYGFIKEIEYENMISGGVKTMFEYGNDSLMPHFIYCFYDSWNSEEWKLYIIIMRKMTDYGIKSAVLTMLFMQRNYLVTKEKAKQATEGKLKNDSEWKDYEG